MDGAVVGTPAYMSPEQALGQIELLGPQSDAYAVGAMLYHLLAGHMPYLPPGTRKSARTILEAVGEHPPRRLEKIDPTLPPELIAICEKAMARELGERYPDIRSIL